jgi:hypothetical protein
MERSVQDSATDFNRTSLQSRFLLGGMIPPISGQSPYAVERGVEVHGLPLEMEEARPDRVVAQPHLIDRRPARRG